MLIAWCLLAAIGLGHFCITVAVINWSHGLGVPERRMRWLAISTLVVSGMVVAAGAWWLAGRPWTAWPIAAQAYGAICAAVACVGLPLATIARYRRPAPGGISGRSAVVDLEETERNTRLRGSLRNSCLFRLPGNESFRVEQTDWTIERPDLPRELDGLTILHLSDLHLARTYDRRFFEAAADVAAARDVDLVFFTGDLLDDADVVEWVAPVLSRVRGNLGSYAILGNHDYRFDVEQLGVELERAGYTVIEGAWAALDVSGVPVAIGGTSAPWGAALDPRTMPAAEARVLLSHTPDLLPKAAAWGVELMFSGHNHGGQVRLPIVGPILMPSRYGRRFDQGFFRMGPTLLYVSRGVGAKHPVRYRCAPEIARFTLRVARAKHPSHRHHRESAVATSRG
jgi:predicted MPP superfamily phosphohydrolase